MTCSIWAGSALTRPSPAGQAADQLDVLTQHAAQHRLHTGEERVQVEHAGLRGWPRLNASKLRVSAAARSPA